ncbi:dUTP diphosphatase [Niallia circulans]|uniref:dUTP diphosphatase n=1 Tax=Niallia circulans TaxID=1397 RepID=UPI0026EEF8BB|nr:dUTP diphosphatase [Niallia circulans]
MDLQEMFELAGRTLREKNIEQGYAILPELTLALQVELSCCASSWDGFRYWENGQKNESCKILDSYINCFRVLLSIGSVISYPRNSYSLNALSLKREETEGSTVEVFLAVHQEITHFIERWGSFGESYAAYEKMFQNFLELGRHLGLLHQVEEAYMSKTLSAISGNI